MRRFFIFSIISVLLSLVELQAAQESLSVEKDLSYMVEAIKNHPVLQSREQMIKYYQQLEISALSLPDIKIAISMDNVPVNNFSFSEYLPSSKTIGVEQKIPSRKIRTLQSNIQKISSNYEELMYDFIYENLKLKLLRSLIDLKKNIDLQGLNQKKIIVLNKKEEYLNREVASGKAISYEALLELDKDLIDAQILNHDLDINKDEIFYNIQNITQISLEQIQQIKVDDLELEKVKWDQSVNHVLSLAPWKHKLDLYNQKIMVEKLRASSPDVALKVAYKIREEGDNFAGDDWFSAGISFSIPIWYSKNQVPRIKAATHAHKKMVHLYQNEVNDFTNQIEILLSKIKVVEAVLELLKRKEEKVNENLKNMNLEYEISNITLEKILNERLKLIVVRQKLIERKAEYLQLIAEFNSLTRSVE